MARRSMTLVVVMIVLTLVLVSTGAAAQTEITAPTIDESTTIVSDPGQVPGLDGDCGCKPWWYWALLVAGGLALITAFYATYRVWRAD